jgi:NAD(P)-dependent dehydrogenase (short-subunit alcohol dehydrogenase family)
LLYLRQGTPFPSCSAPFYTGGTRGIGRAIAELLAEEGCNVALCARHEAAVDETVMALTGKGVKSWGGVADAKALRAWVAEAAAASASSSPMSARWRRAALAQSMDEDSWRRSQEIDIMGTVAGVEGGHPSPRAIDGRRDRRRHDRRHRDRRSAAPLCLGKGATAVAAPD